MNTTIIIVVAILFCWGISMFLRHAPRITTLIVIIASLPQVNDEPVPFAAMSFIAIYLAFRK